MIRNLLQGGDLAGWLLGILYALPGILLALSVHEMSHGYAAYKLGDGTAKAMGRLSLNPLHHIDPIGFLSMLLIGFGWAKPVMVNYRNLKRPQRDSAIVSLAGPLSNFILGFLICLLLYAVTPFLPLRETWGYGIFSILYMAVVLNINLGLFNLIPCPPLDGSKILYGFLPYRTVMKIQPYEPAIQLVLLATLFFGFLSKPLGFLSDHIFDFYYRISSKVLFFL